MSDFDAANVRWAIQTVAEASQLAKAVQAELVTPALTKSDRSPVTVADFAVQAWVSKRLAADLPGDVLVGEEEASDLRDPAAAETLERITHFVRTLAPQASSNEICDWIDLGCGEAKDAFWTLDPIDGTKGFLRRDQYAIALAYIVNGQVQIGVLGCPNLDAGANVAVGGTGSIFVAVRGKGARSASLEAIDKWSPIAASPVADPINARLLASFESGHTDDAKLMELRSALGATAEMVRMDSQAKFAVLATGRGDLLFRLLSPSRMDYREKIWDQAAGMIVIEEAGGQVTDLDGRPLDFRHGRELLQNRGVIASNQRLHPAALAAVRQIGA